MQSVTERFLRYVSVSTASDPESDASPSTSRQLDLSRMLRDELFALGASEVALDEFGYVYAKIPATLPGLPTLGFWPMWTPRRTLWAKASSPGSSKITTAGPSC